MHLDYILATFLFDHLEIPATLDCGSVPCGNFQDSDFSNLIYSNIANIVEEYLTLCLVD